MSRHRLRRLLATCALATTAACTLGVPHAVAAPRPVFTPSPHGAPIRGDVTGDGRPDVLVLGYLGDVSARRCGVQVRAALGHGLTAAPVFLRLPVRGEVVQCPDLGTVLAGPTPGANRLAVGFFDVPPNGDGARVQTFTLVGGTARYRGGATGVQYQPNRIGSQDFDGDGWGDLWENTDQGLGFTACITEGASFRPFVPSVPSGRVSVQFADLDHRRGTDILLGTLAGVAGPAEAVVVDGLTGATQTLTAASETPAGDDVAAFRLALVDLDHDTYPDVQVDALGSGGEVLTTSWFANRSRGGHWSFVPTVPPRYRAPLAGSG